MSKKMRIKTKIVVAYLLLLMLSFVLTFSAVFWINRIYTKKEVEKVGTQTVNALTGNLSLIFDNVTQFSDLVYFDDQVQRALKNVEDMPSDPGIHRMVQKSLTNMILACDYASGVYIWDSCGNFYSSYKKAPEKTSPERIPETGWYQSLPEHKGNGFFIHGSEDIVRYFSDMGYITYIREIKDKNTYKPLAVLMVTVNEETIQSYFDSVGEGEDSSFYIVDSKGEPIVYSGDRKKEGESGDILISQSLGIEDWKLIGRFKTNGSRAMAPYYKWMIILVAAINILFVFGASVLLTKLIFGPLEKVEKHMLIVETGQLVKMEQDGHKDEIANLIRVYNRMIQSIKELIIRVKQEEKSIAKMELNLIQAQINPHFLYNTLDAVSALALVRDYDKCFLMTQSLGNFYRNSLNSGENLITVEDELNGIKSYLSILNIRYDNKIHVEYDVEKQILGCRIIKLLLQPVVENAVYHGIHKNPEGGRLWISGFLDEDEIVFIVTDDGEGIEEEKIREIIEGKTKTGKFGFGVYSMIQRIRLYYGIENPVMIHSEVGNGTEVALRIKKRVPEGEGEYEAKGIAGG